tara:strand:+ start:4465 stop:5058 length:594 start_codon:yes stop_codon:yes gene_type:complete
MVKVLELALVLFASTIIASNIDSDKTNTSTQQIEQVDTIKIDTVIITPTYETKSFKQFLDTLSWRESSGNWKIINRFGYMGKYQLGKMAMKDIGMDSIKVENFKCDSSVFPEQLQEIAIRKYIKKNKKYLKKCIECYKNKTVNGILITESSIIGAAHLVGQRSVKEWLKCDGLITKTDGNGTTIESYLKLFSGYKLS